MWLTFRIQIRHNDAQLCLPNWILIKVYFQVNGKNEDETALDDELGDQEIKIYTQASPQKNMLILDKDRDENEVQTIKEITGNGLSTDNEQRNLEVRVFKSKQRVF